MRVKGVVSEDFVNYKRPSLFINTCYCDFKCCTEAGLDFGVCQNAPLSRSPTLDIPDKQIYRYYADNPITKAVVVGGMEPMLQINELAPLIASSVRRVATAHLSFIQATIPPRSPGSLNYSVAIITS